MELIAVVMHCASSTDRFESAKALLDCAEFYLKLESFDYRKQVMEYNLIG